MICKTNNSYMIHSGFCLNLAWFYLWFLTWKNKNKKWYMCVYPWNLDELQQYEPTWDWMTNATTAMTYFQQFVCTVVGNCTLLLDQSQTLIWTYNSIFKIDFIIRPRIRYFSPSRRVVQQNYSENWIYFLSVLCCSLIDGIVITIITTASIARYIRPRRN